VSDSVGFKISGLEDVLSKLESIGVDVQKKGGRAALRAAARVIRDKAIEGAQSIDDAESRENIAKNIVERWNGRVNKQSGGADLGFRVGVLGGARDYSKQGEIKTGKNAKGNPGGDTFHWRFVEFGTEDTPAKPFMRPALESSQQKVVDTFIREYDKALDRAIKRAQKKAARP